MALLTPHWTSESVEHRPDPLVRTPIRQLTSSPFISSNIYCEQVYASSDGGRIAFLRQTTSEYGRGGEIWVCDLPTYTIARVGPTSRSLAASTPLLDAVYYVRPEGPAAHVLVRLDLRTLELDDVFPFVDCPLPGASTISPDERYFVSSTRLHDNVYGIYRVDLARSRWEFIHEEKDIFNTHIQFEPSEGRDLLVQQNRGAVFDADGRVAKSSGEDGGALYVIDRDGRNQRFLPVGRPHTAAIDGHQCWIGRTGRVLLTVDDTRVNGGQYVVAPGDTEAKRIMPGFAFIHVCASADGRFMTADHGGDPYVYLGSLETGRVLHLCEAPASRGATHASWQEPYITPDNRHVIFNSERTGVAQLYAAVVPDHAAAYLTAVT